MYVCVCIVHVSHSSVRPLSSLSVERKGERVDGIKSRKEEKKRKGKERKVELWFRIVGWVFFLV